MLRKILLSTAAVAALAAPAFAADLPARAAAPAPVYAAPIFTWTGFYVGAQIGYQWGRTNADYYNAAGVFLPGSSARYDANGVVGGLHVGYNHQISSLVLGVEGDIEASGVKGHFTFANGDDYRTRVNWQGSLRARLGYAMGPALLYLTGGAAFADLHNSALNFAAATRVGHSKDWGWTLGGGVEYAINNNWTTRLEYRYTDFGKNSFSLAPAFGGSERAKNTFHTVRLGLTYKFGGPSAVVAKY